MVSAPSEVASEVLSSANGGALQAAVGEIEAVSTQVPERRANAFGDKEVSLPVPPRLLWRY